MCNIRNYRDKGISLWVDGSEAPFEQLFYSE